MPRNVRNFWIDANIDGRATTLSGGPQAKNGGMSVRFRQRSQGGVVDALRVDGFATDDGWVRLTVRDHEGNVITTVETHRDLGLDYPITTV